MIENQGQPQISYPSETKRDIEENIASLSKIFSQYTNLIEMLRREWRGEGMFEDENHNIIWIQVTKPVFIKLDSKGNPLTNKIKMGNQTREIYVPNDDAIETVLRNLKLSGLNMITAVTNISENEIIDDLREIECKIAALLTLKQKEWGIDKELLPILMSDLKCIIKDARYVAKDGHLLGAMREVIQRIEHYIEGGKKEGITDKMTSPFRQ